MKIEVTLLDIVKNDKACSAMGYSLWCINEGANPDEKIMLSEEDAKEYGFIK